MSREAGVHPRSFLFIYTRVPLQNSVIPSSVSIPSCSATAPLVGAVLLKGSDKKEKNFKKFKRTCKEK